MATKESIFVVRTAERDRLDTSAPNVSPDVEIPLCVVVPLLNTGEETFQGQIVTADFFVKCPAGSDVKADDKVKIRGDLCEVQGAPGDFGRKGVLFQARRIGTR